MISEQEFIKYRCLVAMVHADGIVYSEESKMIEDTLAEVDLSEDQKMILKKDMEVAKNLTSLYAGLNDDDQKHHLVQLAFKLFWADDCFHTAEQKIFVMLREGL